MTGDPERWIVIPRWDGPEGFQHYRDRRPRWIKNYVELLSRPEYARLTFPQRGLLHGIWLLYAGSHQSIPVSTLYLSRQLSGRVTKGMLDSLNHAGFIRFSASKPLAKPEHLASPEKETEKELDLQDQNQVPYTPRPPARANGHHNDPQPIAAIIAESLAAAQPKGTRIE